MDSIGFAPWPDYTIEEADTIKNVLLSNKVNYWTGQEAREFENEFADWVGTKYAIALANGTVALEAALLALGVSGSEVIVTSRTFLASASCIVTAGATPIFADVDRNTQNITAETIRAVITPKTKAIICVHLAGWPCEMDAIMDLANELGIYVIEDCAQAHGAQYKGRSVGSIGHVAAWSFCQDKIMTTGGEGGMVTTNDKQLWQRIWSYKDHGKSWEAVYEKNHQPGFRWLHDSFGTNFRLTELQAALGRIQLKRMPQWGNKRRQNAHQIWAAASQISGLRVPTIPTHITHAVYKSYVFVKPEQLAQGWDRDKIIKCITESGVPCYSGSCSEVYLEKAFDNTNWRPAKRLPVARELGETSMVFLVHPTLDSKAIEKTCHVLEQVMLKATSPKKVFVKQGALS